MNSSPLRSTVRSYAKINFTLDVLGKRDDGYHAIESVMQSISLHDRILLRAGNEPGIHITCNSIRIPTDERNLAYKAAAFLFEAAGIAPCLDIHVEKRIPVQAGLGGGSSNAAAVLRGLNRLMNLSMNTEELCQLAIKIGSDVPFFLFAGTALAEGRGESVIPLPDAPKWWLTIVKPPFGVSTPWAYHRIDEMTEKERNRSTQRMITCMEENCGQIPALLGNDLELPSIEKHAELANIKSQLLDAGAHGALMCGSGSAVFGLFDSERGARTATARMMRDRFRVFASRTITRGEALEIG